MVSFVTKKNCVLTGGYQFQVAENLPPGTLVGRVTARDADHGRNAVVSYTLSSPDDDVDAASAFQIDRVSGEITTTRKLDREQQDAIRLIVEASDGASPPLSSTVDVVVHVADENDNQPLFVLDLENEIKVEDALTVAVSPRLPPGSVVTPLRAVDRDAGNNSRVTYRLLPLPGCGDAAGYDVISGGDGDDVISMPAGRRQCGLFGVDSQQEGLILSEGGKGLAGFDDGTDFNVTVTATDAGVPSLTGTVLIRVVVNSTVPLPTVPTQRRHQHPMLSGRGTVALPTVPTQRHHQHSDGGWISLLVRDGVIVVCSLVAFIVIACCLSVVVVVLATRRARARQRRAKHGYNCRAEEEKVLGGTGVCVDTDPAFDRSAPSVVVYGSCESPRTVPACNWHDVGSPRTKRNGWSSSQMT